MLRNTAWSCIGDGSTAPRQIQTLGPGLVECPQELATPDCARLDADEISVVLSGGAVVSIYSKSEAKTNTSPMTSTSSQRALPGVSIAR